MKYLRYSSIVMSCLPILFGLSLYSYYFWYHHFGAGHPRGVFPKGLLAVSWTTDWLATFTLYSVPVNFFLAIILLGIGLSRGEYVFRFVTFYCISITILIIIVVGDPFGALAWYLD